MKIYARSLWGQGSGLTNSISWGSAYLDLQKAQVFQDRAKARGIDTPEELFLCNAEFVKGLPQASVAREIAQRFIARAESEGAVGETSQQCLVDFVNGLIRV